MAVTYGFFNSQNDDRTYDADDFNTFFEGLITQNGVFEYADNAFAVSPGSTGLTVNVGTGKAMVQSHWVKSDAVETLSLSAANSLLSRYDMITLRYDATNRNITLQVTEGTSSSYPEQPMPQQTTDLYEIVLAYVYVGAGASSITSQNILDMRADTSLCGYIYSLLDVGSELQKEIEALQISVNNNTTDVNNLWTEIADTGWQDAPVEADPAFAAYSSTSGPRYRKIGKVVHIDGVIKPTATIIGSVNKIVIFTLPEGFRTDRIVGTVCQGSGVSKWYLSVEINGTVCFQRYENGGQLADCPTTAWLPFAFSFVAAD